MKPFKPRTILVALAEPQERAQPALVRAVQIAKVFGAELVLFHAAFESALSGRPFFDNKRLAQSRGWRLDERRRALERHAQKARRDGLTVRTAAVWEEPAHEAIIRAAIREGAELIVAGPHVRGRPQAPVALRQTDWHLLRLCPQPLLLVHAVNRIDGPVLAALDPLHPKDKPAALDRALAHTGGAIAAALGSSFYAAHSIPASLYAPGEDRDRAFGRMREQATRAMRKTLERAGVEPARTYTVEGLPEKTLPALARKIGAQLLVMGAVSRRGLQRLALGDTAERIIHAAPCDLLIVKPPRFTPRLGRSRREAVILPED